MCFIYNQNVCSIECSTTYDVSIDKEIRINDTSDINVSFCSSSIPLDEVTVTLINISNLVIGSASNKTSIMGKGHSGFHLKNVGNVSILLVELIECGRAFKFDSNDTAFAAMLIEDSFDVKLKNVHFINSNGSGLIMLNVGGNSKLTNCSFKSS